MISGNVTPKWRTLSFWRWTGANWSIWRGNATTRKWPGRGLHRRSVAPADAQDVEPDTGIVEEDEEVEEPVSAGFFSYPEGATRARALLRAEQIPCFLDDEHLVQPQVGRVGAHVTVPAAFPGPRPGRAGTQPQ